AEHEQKHIFKILLQMSIFTHAKVHKKEIIIARSAGFCFGVKRAVNMAYAAEVKNHTYTYGPIIHNEFVINELEKKGIKSIESIGDDPIDTLIIRAHGVGKSVYEIAKQKNINIIDATCPYVSKIHKLVESYRNKGYKIIIIGDESHPEIIGINGWTEYEGIILKDAQTAEEYIYDNDAQYLVVSQTTYKKSVVEEILNTLTKKNVLFSAISTICNATTERQEEAKIIAEEVDVMIVIGSKSSSNTQKLYEISKKYCSKTYCITNEHEFSKEMVLNAKKIGITAGASTPKELLDAVIKCVKDANAENTL
ncbi:MAG: 4-hydroxy-3-methylbut-2-enyl diphosphate reductase, partial [Cellulosilyticaceae bacterium]